MVPKTGKTSETMVASVPKVQTSLKVMCQYSLNQRRNCIHIILRIGKGPKTYNHISNKEHRPKLKVLNCRKLGYNLYTSIFSYTQA